MHLAIIPLAQMKGTVTMFRRGARYEVELQHRDGSVSSEWIDVIDGESNQDAKARAVGAVGMLGYWPELRRAMAEERRVAEAGKGEWSKGFTVPIDAAELDDRAAGAELRRTTERLVEKALSTSPPKIILPPGVRDA